MGKGKTLDEHRPHHEQLDRAWGQILAELERFMDEGVRKALSRLHLPKREEVQELERRLGSLAQRIERLDDKESR